MTQTSFIPLSIPVLHQNEWTYIKDCLDTGWVSSVGSYVTNFEKNLAQYVKSPHAIATINGTAALHICLQLSGVGLNDEVIAPDLTFIAPINAITYVGAKPVFMDCDPFLNMDGKKLKSFCENECDFKNGVLVNKKTKAPVKAIIVVHVFGHPAMLDDIVDIGKKYNLSIIEDATESLGSKYTIGRYAGKFTGTIGDFGCYSFNGNKIITTGSGGMIVTNSEKYANKAKYLTTQAKDDAKLFVHHEIGYNYRLSNVLAAMGCAQLEKLDDIISKKRANFVLYQKELASVPGLSLLEEPNGTQSNYWFYTLKINSSVYGLSNLELMSLLEKNKIETRPVWELNHRQRPFKNCPAYQIEQAPLYHSTCLNLPCSINLTIDDIKRVCSIIKQKQ